MTRSTVLMIAIQCVVVAGVIPSAWAISIANTDENLGAPWMPKDKFENSQFYLRTYDLDNNLQSDSGDRFLFNQYDFSGVAVAAYNPDGTTHGTKCATLVSPQHFISAAHAHPAVGTTIAFRNTDGQIVSRVVTGYAGVGPDIYMGTFDTAFTEADKVAHYGVVADLAANVVFEELYNFGELYGYPRVSNGKRRSYEMLYYAGDGQVARTYSLSSAYLPDAQESERFRYDIKLASMSYDINGFCSGTGGDSGFCSFYMVDGELVIVGTHSTTTGDCYVPQAIYAMNQAMAGSGYQVREVSDFGTQPTYTPLASQVRSKAALQDMPTTSLEMQMKSNCIIGNTLQVGDQSIRVTSLGLQDYAYNGLAEDHVVGIWGADGTLLASVVVPAGKGAELESDWRYVQLDAPVSLEAGETFYVGAFTSAADPFYYSYANVATGEDVGGRFGGDGVLQSNSHGDGWLLPTTWGFIVPPDWATWYANFAANAQYEVVPEPGTLLLCLAGLAGMAIRRRRNQ